MRWPLRLTILLSVAELCVATQADAVPSFSGAEGFGAITPGGRGGQVIHVTNLDDSGPGSFREAVTASGPRTVVFDVAGTINLESEINVLNPYLTIAGQTAPGGGITIAGETLSLDVHDVVVRYVRLRRGYDFNNPDPREDDSLGSDRTNSNDLNNPKTGNIIVDHVSASWGLDENLSIYRSKLNAALDPGPPASSTVLPTRNVTLQWSISSEALNPFRHAFGSTLGGAGVNHHHNLWASNTGRNPSISFSDFLDFRNNVLFNWMHRSVDGAGPEAHVNMISNYYRPGPATGFSNDVTPQPVPELKVLIVEPELRTGPPYTPETIGDWYVDGNVIDGSAIGQDFSEVSADNWEGEAEVAPGVFARGVQFEDPYPVEWARVNSPITHVERPDDPDDPFDDDGSITLGQGTPIPIPDLPVIATQSAQEAFQSVLAGAGASLVRDAVDVRVVNSVATGIATAGPRGDGIIIHPNDVGGYPVIPFVQRDMDFDTDQDGIPNEWEERFGLDSGDPDDRNGDFDADGFTNLEEYLNELGAFQAVQDVVWDNELASGRYAQIENWDLAFQPSRFDTAVIHSGTVVVDAIGQDAGTLKLATGASDNATLSITAGWLHVADELVIGAAAGATAALYLSGGELATPRLSQGDSGSFAFTGGSLHAGEVAFDLVNDGGTISPGSSTGITHVVGSLTIDSGAMEIELASAEDHDQVTVDDSATLAGELNVILLNGFTRPAGTTLEILTAAGGVAGRFDALNAPELAGRMWRLEYSATSVELLALVTGDYNANGVVDAADYTVWRDTLGQTGAGLAADGDADGMIDSDDYDRWKSNFGTIGFGSASAHAVSAVPEPASLSLLLVWAAITLFKSRRGARELVESD